MMEPVIRIDGTDANACQGTVQFDIKKSVWNLGMLFCAVCFAPSTVSFSSVILFLVLTYTSLLVGHSAGMHRMMIHRAFECKQPVERILIYIGVLVGMSGPHGIIAIHDLRDWAQRQPKCHEFFSHEKPFLYDLWWQLTSKFNFSNPPIVHIEAKYSQDPFYVHLERFWQLHQLLFAILLYAIGGWSFVVWGIFVRVSVSIIGHWAITYVCHNPGPGKWRVKNAAVQASNIPGLGLLTYGECWHNNHHAFPESARIGLEQGQHDPCWAFITLMRRFGLAYNIGLPRDKNAQEDLYLHQEEQ